MDLVVLWAYWATAILWAVFLATHMCPVCMRLDSFGVYWGNVIAQSALWPITIPLTLSRGNPPCLLLHSEPEKEVRSYQKCFIKVDKAHCTA